MWWGVLTLLPAFNKGGGMGGSAKEKEIKSHRMLTPARPWDRGFFFLVVALGGVWSRVQVCGNYKIQYDVVLLHADFLFFVRTPQRHRVDRAFCWVPPAA